MGFWLLVQFTLQGQTGTLSEHCCIIYRLQHKEGSVGVKRVIVLAPSANMPAQEAFILSASAGVSIFSLNTIFLSSYPGKPPDAALRFVLPQYGLAVLTMTTGFLAFTLSGIAVLGILTGLSILQILYSLRYFPDPNAE